MRVTRTSGWLVLLLIGSGLMVGCGKDSEQSDYKNVEGRITNINRQTDEVTMTYYNEKHKEERELKGKLAPNAEILIDGVTASLSDLRVADKVKVMGRVDRQGDTKLFVATAVEVMREGPASDTVDPTPADSNGTSTQPSQ